MKLLKKYFKLQKQIYQYFGYVEDWVVIPLDDQTEQHWMLFQSAEGGGTIAWAPEPFTKESIESGGALYSGKIYTQRFLPQWVYRGEEYTMVCVDTQCDGNKFLMVFSNDKEESNSELKELYLESW